VTSYYWDAGKKGAFPLGTYYFGSYSPSDGGYADALPPASSDFGQRRHTYAFTRSGTPITTVVANRRYVLGAWSRTVYPLDTLPDWLIAGARVKYTCATACG